jgi:hypothetical protein
MSTIDDRYRRLRRKYNITDRQWHALWDAQHGKCFICRKSFSRSRLACVDHDHTSGLVRGLLCTDCNYELGLRHDNAEWFSRAAAYLNSPIAVDIIGTVYVPGSVGEAHAPVS